MRKKLLLSLALLAASCGGGGGGSGSGSGSSPNPTNPPVSSPNPINPPVESGYCFDGTNISIRNIQVLDAQTNQPIPQTGNFYTVSLNQKFKIVIHYTTNARCVVFNPSWCDADYCSELSLNSYYEYNNPSVNECKFTETTTPIRDLKLQCTFGSSSVTNRIKLNFLLCVQSMKTFQTFCDEKSIFVRVQ